MEVGIKEALSKLKEQGFNVDDADIAQIKSDVQDEYDCGADGTVYDVLMDINDSVGLDDYNIFYEED